MRLLAAVLIMMTTLAFTCNEEELESSLDGLIFGVYNGFCMGSECLKIYQIKENTLYKEQTLTNRNFSPPIAGDYIILSQSDLEMARELLTDFPSDLLDEEEVIGCPGCHDQSTIYVQLEVDGESRFWRIDSDLDAIPGYLRAYASKIVEVVDKLE